MIPGQDPVPLMVKVFPREISGESLSKILTRRSLSICKDGSIDSIHDAFNDWSSLFRIYVSVRARLVKDMVKLPTDRRSHQREGDGVVFDSPWPLSLFLSRVGSDAYSDSDGFFMTLLHTALAYCRIFASRTLPYACKWSPEATLLYVLDSPWRNSIPRLPRTENAWKSCWIKLET